MNLHDLPHATAEAIKAALTQDLRERDACGEADNIPHTVHIKNVQCAEGKIFLELHTDALTFISDERGILHARERGKVAEITLDEQTYRVLSFQYCPAPSC
jgi:hypothetical protein